MDIILKQAKLLALTICLLVLCGCSKSEKYEEMYSKWRDSYISLAEHSIEAVVTASDENKVCEYTLLYTLNTDGETVQVLAPELIADITAHIEKDGTRLSFEGAMLETGSTLSENLSPLMALPTFMDIIKEGHSENSWRETKDEKEFVVTELEMPDGTIMTLWQNSTDMSPVYADVRSSDRVEIKINFTKVE